MSDHPQEDHSHSSFIQTPKQLVAVIVLAFVVPIALISILAALVTSSRERSQPVSEETVARRLKPVGEVVIAEGSDTPGQRTGKQIVESVCAACHATGALNAPKIGDTAAWAPHIKQGLDKLTQVAIEGVRQMPPRGGDPNLTDVEVARAVAYLANQSGANFKEPPVQQGAPVQVAAAAAPATDAAAAVAAAGAAKAGDAARGGDAAKGKSVYDATCNVCHGAGVAGAPKSGDKAAWAPRLKQGMPALYETAMKGKGAMPPKGGNNALSDADVKAAVDYMVGLVK